MPNNHEAPSGVELDISLEEEMELFDKLPKELRKLIRNGPFDLWSIDVYNGYTKHGLRAARFGCMKAYKKDLALANEELLARIEESKQERKR